ncbi:HPr kinase/phosphorylase [Brevundimonas sp.]|uniref:HPr kinase/phosphorylase n=1 Tax=Brevundimonas sp. TaxID=1871086 RepID=UPI0035190A52
MPVGDQFLSRAFGLLWRSDRPLDQFTASGESGAVDVTVRRFPRLEDRPGGTPINNGEVFADGARFSFGDATFDVFGGERVDWASPSDDAVPAAFFGTVVAIILAWRGLVPLHGSAVEIGGQAVLLAGPSGAGKSTLCDALVRRGGKLVSDDLSVMKPVADGGTPVLLPGRPAIRLFPDGAPSAEIKQLHPAPMVDPTQTVPLSSLVLLQPSAVSGGLPGASEALSRQLFRPQWMQVLPHRQTRLASLFFASRNVTMLTLPGAKDRPDISINEKVDQLMSALSNADGHGPRFGE